METVLPKRKSHHLQGYDYSQNGAYFITICTHQRRMLFGPNRAPVGADSISARMAARVFREIIGQYHRSISTFGSVPFTTTSSAMKPITA